jgi:hypothetical protein
VMASGCSLVINSSATSPSGTWRSMGNATNTPNITLYLRIS